MQPITVESLRNDHTFRYALLSEIQQLTEATGGGANATLLSGIKDAIDGIVPLIDGLELITGNIKIEAKTINLATNQVEDKLTDLGESLATLNSLTSAESADIALIQTWVKNALAVLRLTQSTIESDLPGLRFALDNLLEKVTQVYGSTSNLDRNVAAFEDLIRDRREEEETQQVTSGSEVPMARSKHRLRGLLFSNYQDPVVWLQIFGTDADLKEDSIPSLPPIAVSKNQFVILDQSLLGVDGFGFDGFTVRVSTQAYKYSPTDKKLGIWHMTTRSKAL